MRRGLQILAFAVLLSCMALAQEYSASDAQTGIAIGQMQNPSVWSKRLGLTKKLVVERAYVYPTPTREKELQFAFIIVDEKAKGHRQLQWVRTGEFATVVNGFPYPSPGVEMLDATLTSEGELLVLFNQYGLCWAFRISTDPNQSERNWHAVPDEKVIEARSIEDSQHPWTHVIPLSLAMKAGNIALDDQGRLQATCVNDKLDKYSFRLEKQADVKLLWSSDPPRPDPSKEPAISMP